VCAVQPSVFVDHAEQRTAGIDPNDIRSPFTSLLATLTVFLWQLYV